MSANPADPIRIVYFGTPAYAVPALNALFLDPRADVVLVVTQPDRPAGRGRTLTPPPVKQTALAHGRSVYQPETLRTAEDRDPIAAVAADLFVVAAFGKIFGPKLLALPRLGAVNLHASLLPLYRGASPISAAILEGRDETGITLMRMDTGLDTGPILAHRSLPITADSTTASLTPRLASIGAELLIDSLGDLQGNALPHTPQSDREASLTRPMVKADGWIDWNRPAVEIERRVRAMWDWPRGWTTLKGEPIQIHRAKVDPSPATSTPGTMESEQGVPIVSTGAGRLILEIVQSAGGKPLSGDVWLRQTTAIGDVLGTQGGPEPPAVPLIRRVLP